MKILTYKEVIDSVKNGELESEFKCFLDKRLSTLENISVHLECYSIYKKVEDYIGGLSMPIHPTDDVRFYIQEEGDFKIKNPTKDFYLIHFFGKAVPTCIDIESSNLGELFIYVNTSDENFVIIGKQVNLDEDFKVFPLSQFKITKFMKYRENSYHTKEIN